MKSLDSVDLLDFPCFGLWVPVGKLQVGAGVGEVSICATFKFDLTPFQRGL